MMLCPRCDNAFVEDCKHCAAERENSQPGCMNSAHGDAFDLLVEKYGDEGGDEKYMPFY